MSLDFQLLVIIHWSSHLNWKYMDGFIWHGNISNAFTSYAPFISDQNVLGSHHGSVMSFTTPALEGKDHVFVMLEKAGIDFA